MRLITAILVASTGLASPHAAAAQVAGTLGAPNARVAVSRQELRVVFPRDTATTWGWPDQIKPGHRGSYLWNIFFDGVDGYRHLSVAVQRSEPGARAFTSLESLVAAARSSFCPPDVIGACPAPAASLSVSDGRVVLTYRDSATIARLFLLRQETVVITRWTPVDSLPIRDTVRVEYIEPEIPLPNAETFAEAERASCLRSVGAPG